MTSTQLLRCQHNDTAAMIERLHRLLDHCGGADHANLIMQQLAKLTQLMRVHFAHEDYCLYPALTASANAEVVEAARSFKREMGELWEQYEAFARNWTTLAAIITEFDAFKAECIAIFGAIEDRCKRENELLFPLADAIGESLAG